MCKDKKSRQTQKYTISYNHAACGPLVSLSDDPVKFEIKCQIRIGWNQIACASSTVRQFEWNPQFDVRANFYLRNSLLQSFDVLLFAQLNDLSMFDKLFTPRQVTSVLNLHCRCCRGNGSRALRHHEYINLIGILVWPFLFNGAWPFRIIIIILCWIGFEGGAA